MLLFPAPYGRYSDKRYGCFIPGKFAWITQESPAFLVPALLLATTSSPCWQSTANKVLISCFVLHYIQRSLIFPLTITGGKPTPFTPYVSALVFCVFNGFMQGHHLLNHRCYDEAWVSSPHFMIGMAMFGLGMFINIQSDQILTHLRKPGETGYKIPTGGLFDYVTGANFFGEIVEWCGFAVASWSAVAAVFALFTTVFLGLRARHHHQYYLAKFDDYPRSRKILVPFLI